jgi:hypothetical protein
MVAMFNIANWYWRVAASATQLYSSSIGDYVPVNDSNYQTWLTNNIPTNIPTEFELGQVLAASISLLQVTTSTSLAIQQALKQAQLDALLATKADTVGMVQGGQSSTTTGTGVANYLSASTNNYRSLRAQIAAATTAAQVQAININGGWPSNP